MFKEIIHSNESLNTMTIHKVYIVTVCNRICTTDIIHFESIGMADDAVESINRHNYLATDVRVYAVPLYKSNRAKPEAKS